MTLTDKRKFINSIREFTLKAVITDEYLAECRQEVDTLVSSALPEEVYKVFKNYPEYLYMVRLKIHNTDLHGRAVIAFPQVLYGATNSIITKKVTEFRNKTNKMSAEADALLRDIDTEVTKCRYLNELKTKFPQFEKFWPSNAPTSLAIPPSKKEVVLETETAAQKLHKFIKEIT